MMRIAPMAWGFVAFGMAGDALAEAPQIRYRGPVPGTPTARVEVVPGHVREVTVGDEIPEWGRVTEVAETHLLIEKRLTEAEQAQLRSQGKAVYEILELRIPRTGPGGAGQLPHR